MERRSYRELEKGVWEAGICSGCGACAVACPSDSIFFSPEGGATRPCHTGYCKEDTDHVACGACAEVCPRLNPPTHGEDALGTFMHAMQARAAFSLPKRQSGGAVTAILKYGLDRGLLDGVVAVTEDPWSRHTSSVLLESGEALERHAGSRYGMSGPPLAVLRRAVMEERCSRLGIVGLPCAVSAIRRMKESRHQLLKPYGDAIRLIIGLFCTESFDPRPLFEEQLRLKRGIQPWMIRKLDVKGKLEVQLEDRSLSIPLAELENCIRSGCRYCVDFSSTDADISAGSVGAGNGFTTLLIRTETGEGFVRGALSEGLLEENGTPELEAVRRLAEKKRMKALRQQRG